MAAPAKRDIESKLSDAFKELLETMSYEKVTVSAICDKADVSRNTFYAYFHDKEDIVKHLFRLHFAEPIEDLLVLLEAQDTSKLKPIIYERSYQGIFDEREYYTNLVRPIYGKNDVFIRSVIEVLTAMNMDAYRKVGMQGDDWEIAYISYFLSASQAMLLIRWINDGMVISPKGLAGFYNAITQDIWRHRNELFR